MIKRKYPHLETVSLSKDIFAWDLICRKYDYVSWTLCSGLPEFYKIVTMVGDPEKVAFVGKKLTSSYLEHFRSFELVENIYADTEFFDPEALNNHHPLTAYTVGVKELMTPKVCLLH